MNFAIDELKGGLKKQPLSLLATAIRMLEKKPKPIQMTNGHNFNNYAKQMRPRSAYIVYNKQTPLSSTFNSSQQNLPYGIYSKQGKQLKTKQNFYMSLINPPVTRDTKFAMTAPSRIKTPLDFHIPYRPPKANTLSRSSWNDGKRIRVNHKLYLDMIRPVMAAPEYTKLAPTKRTQHASISPRTMSRQLAEKRQSTNQNGRETLKALDPNPHIQKHQRHIPRSEGYLSLQRHLYLQQYQNSILNSSLSNSTRSKMTAHKQLHLPHIESKRTNGHLFQPSLHTRSRIP